MSISKEIFGIEHKQNVSSDSEYKNIYANGWNDCKKTIDQYELSEEVIANAIYHVDTSDYKNCLQLAKLIKRNQSKIFVRKSK